MPDCTENTENTNILKLHMCILPLNPEEKCVLCEAKREQWIIVTLNSRLEVLNLRLQVLNSKTFHAKLQLFKKKKTLTIWVRFSCQTLSIAQR